MHLEELDVVRVVRLRTAERPYDGTEGVLRAPRLGDEGTVVLAAARGDADGTVMVECVDADGMTIWLADFATDELELTDAAIEARRQRAVRRARRWALGGTVGVTICTIGLFVANPRGLALIWLFPGVLLALPLVMLGTADLGRALGAAPDLTRLLRVSYSLLGVPRLLVGVAGIFGAAFGIDFLLSSFLSSPQFWRLDGGDACIALAFITFLGVGGIYLLIQRFPGRGK